MAAGHGVKEDAFEVKSDIHGTVHGPKCGRALAASKVLNSWLIYFGPGMDLNSVTPHAHPNEILRWVVRT
jgi:hypothetical protein